VFTVSNGVNPDAFITFVLTVKSPGPPVLPPVSGDGTGIVDGSQGIIPGAKLNDSVDWMAIAEKNGYFLIVRMRVLDQEVLPYGANNQYNSSNVKSELEKWYNNDGTSVLLSTGTLAGLKAVAVPSDATSQLGVVYSANTISQGFSTPAGGGTYGAVRLGDYGKCVRLGHPERLLKIRGGDAP